MSLMALLIIAGIIFIALVGCTFIKDKRKSYTYAFIGVFAMIGLLVGCVWANYPLIFYSMGDRQLAMMNADNGYVIAKNLDDAGSAKFVVAGSSWSKELKSSGVEGVVYGLRFGGAWNHNIERYGYSNYIEFGKGVSGMSEENIDKIIADLQAMKPDYVVLDANFPARFYQKGRAAGMKFVVALLSESTVPQREIDSGNVEFVVTRDIRGGLFDMPPSDWEEHTAKRVGIIKKSK